MHWMELRWRDQTVPASILHVFKINILLSTLRLLASGSWQFVPWISSLMKTMNRRLAKQRVWKRWAKNHPRRLWRQEGLSRLRKKPQGWLWKKPFVWKGPQQHPKGRQRPANARHALQETFWKQTVSWSVCSRRLANLKQNLSLGHQRWVMNFDWAPIAPASGLISWQCNCLEFPWRLSTWFGYFLSFVPNSFFEFDKLFLLNFWDFSNRNSGLPLLENVMKTRLPASRRFMHTLDMGVVSTTRTYRSGMFLGSLTLTST